ncbi:MAG: ribonuclease H [Candidatus Omnitrophota bacterium]|nr:MAG: ribonuclease H [Candidatus Omnitrophota bacterium]
MIKVFIDGASGGNPGRAGIGYLIYKGENLVKRRNFYLGITTNNFAEYMALIFSLIEVLNLEETSCCVYSDSKLLCEQIKGNFKVKNKNLYPLYILCRHIISFFKQFKIIHIPRKKNKEADKLAKDVIKEVEE